MLYTAVQLHTFPVNIMKNTHKVHLQAVCTVFNTFTNGRALCVR